MATFGGGRDAPYTLGEESSQCVATLIPGTWVAHETTFSLPPVEFTVTGGKFVAGSNILSITAMSGQPHIMMMPVPADTTADEFVDILTSGRGDAPSPMMIAEPLTLNRTMWTELELESGAYGMACFFPDQHVEMPHVMLGMSAVIEVPQPRSWLTSQERARVIRVHFLILFISKWVIPTVVYRPTEPQNTITTTSGRVVQLQRVHP